MTEEEFVYILNDNGVSSDDIAFVLGLLKLYPHDNVVNAERLKYSYSLEDASFEECCAIILFLWEDSVNGQCEIIERILSRQPRKLKKYFEKVDNKGLK